MDDTLDTLYEKIGGIEICRRLSILFHDRVAGDPVLRQVFPKNLAPTTEWLALFLAERLGGPADYTARRGKNSLLCRHAHVPIGSAEGEQWLSHMSAAMDEAGLPESVRLQLSAYFRQTADTLSDPFLFLYHLPLDALQAALDQNPALVADNRGRSLLREAAGRWDLPRIQMLLANGADVQVKDHLGYDALSQTARTCPPQRDTEGRAVVELLLQYGADVNSRSGPGCLTPLHLAARRGSVAVAEVLLNAGAEIEAKDAKGETPLRRAVNCGQEGMVRLLLSWGADPLTQDKQGRAARDATRHEFIREALRQANRNK